MYLNDIICEGMTSFTFLTTWFKPKSILQALLFWRGCLCQFSFVFVCICLYVFIVLLSYLISRHVFYFILYFFYILFKFSALTSSPVIFYTFNEFDSQNLIGLGPMAQFHENVSSPNLIIDVNAKDISLPSHFLSCHKHSSIQT